MERFGLLLTIFFVSFAALSCSQKKTVETVFPDSNDKSGAIGDCDQAQRLENRFIVQWEDGSISVEDGPSSEAFIIDFVEPKLSEIRFVEFDRQIPVPDFLSHSSDLSTFRDDPIDWGQRMIQSQALLEQGVDGAGVLVAVVDSGVDINHKQLRSRIAINNGEIPNNNRDDDRNGLIDDYYGYDFSSNSGAIYDVLGHGSHVAGIIAADALAGPAIGVAPKAEILALNFMSQNGGAISDAIRAIDYSVDRGAQVINASWGGSACSKLLGEAIQRAGAKGVVFIAAAGNSFVNLEIHPDYPAVYTFSNQLTVGASTSLDFTADFSNYSRKFVHVMAPGDGIYSTVPGDTYDTYSGTSMAAPFVSGVAAMLKGAFPGATAEQVIAAIVKSVDPGNFVVASEGRINAPKAYEYLRKQMESN